MFRSGLLALLEFSAFLKEEHPFASRQLKEFVVRIVQKCLPEREAKAILDKGAQFIGENKALKNALAKRD
ncbi:MAG: hypothetical protein AAGJ35_02025, partial [Myxococcota bacterium]